MAKKMGGLSLKQAAELFELLASEPRLRLALLLAQRGEAHVNALCKGVMMPQSAVSHHLGLLRLGGLVAPRRDGQRTYYRLTLPLVGQLLRLVCGQSLLGCQEQGASRQPRHRGRPRT
jgi:DNA-binding transcriptional ArsR family regulator